MVLPIAVLGYVVTNPIAIISELIVSILPFDLQEKAEEELMSMAGSDQKITGGRLCNLYNSITESDLAERIANLLPADIDNDSANKVELVFICFQLPNPTDEQIKKIIEIFVKENDSQRAYNQIMTLDFIRTAKSFEKDYFIELLDSSSKFLVGEMSNIEGLTIRDISPADDLYNPFYFSNLNWYYTAGYVSQCTWYTIGRVQEQAHELGREINTQVLMNLGHGNANTFVRALDPKINPGVYGYSYDIKDARPGAIIVWDGGLYQGEVCGHVAVVEKVNEDGTITYSEGWSIDGEIGFACVTKSLNYVLNRPSASGNPYRFQCYIYIL